MEQITGEQLEARSWDKENYNRNCSECGEIIDTEQDTHGISIDGEKYVCEGCLKECAKIGTYDTKHDDVWGGIKFGKFDITIGGNKSAPAALKAAADFAEEVWNVKSYLEVN